MHFVLSPPLLSFRSYRSWEHVAETLLPSKSSQLSVLSDTENDGLGSPCKTRRYTVNVLGEQTCYDYNSKGQLSLKNDSSIYVYTVL